MTVVNAEPMNDLSAPLMAHRALRAFEDRAIEPDPIDRVLVESLAGSSSSGNLDLVSVIKTRDAARMHSHGITPLAQFDTSKIKHDPDRFAEGSAALHALLAAPGFLGEKGS